MLNLNLITTTLIVFIGLSSARISNYKWYEQNHIPKADNLFPNYWYDQNLDHSNPSDLRAFKQRYMVNENFFDKSSDGPAFLLIGGEGRINSGWMQSQQPVKYAEEYNGLFFQLEHRYYGLSGPLRDNTTNSLQYLTAEQALADAAQFIIFMTKKYNLNINKWVAIGGSYSGNLATWIRYKYPHLVAGSVAFSGPVLAKVDFSEYLEVVETSIRTHSESCGDHITIAFQEVEAKMNTSDGRAELQKKFNYPIPLDEVVKDGYTNAQFYASIAGIFVEAVQYNRDNTSFHRIDYCCAVMNNPDQDPLDNLAELYTGDANDLSNPNPFMNQWLFQTCDEFGYFQSSSDKAPMFGDHFPLQYEIENCNIFYGDEYNESFIDKAVERTNVNFGGLNPVGLTNVISVHGTIDPWHVLGFTKDLNELSPVTIVEGASHCQAMNDPVPGEVVPPTLPTAQEQILNIIGTWIQ